MSSSRKPIVAPKSPAPTVRQDVVVREDAFHEDAIERACVGKSPAYVAAYKSAMAKYHADSLAADAAFSAAVAKAVDRYLDGPSRAATKNDTSDRSAALAEQARKDFGNGEDQS